MERAKRLAGLILAAGVVLILVAAERAPLEIKAPIITKEALKAMLGKPGLVILDVRHEEQWRFSNSKIPGAVHEDPNVPDTWMKKYPKNKTLVFYCA